MFITRERAFQGQISEQLEVKTHQQWIGKNNKDKGKL